MPPTKLAPIITPALLSSIRSTPRLPHHCWYYVVGVTLSTINRPEEIPKVLSYALEHGVGPEGKDRPVTEHEERLNIARRMREGLVKSAAVVGLPKVSGLRTRGFLTEVPIECYI